MCIACGTCAPLTRCFCRRVVADDLSQLARVTNTLAGLTSITLGRNHEVARAAREHAAAAAENLGIVTAHIRRDVAARYGLDIGGGTPSGADVQRKAAAQSARGGGFRRPAEHAGAAG